MILHRLLIQDFRGVVREEVDVPERGVLVIEGPNESGKTSLVDALEMLLNHKASSGRADVKAAKPVGRDVPVIVEAEFSVDGRRLVYRKEFNRGKKTVLEFPGSTAVALTGDDAHDHVTELLDKQVDRSLWSALRIAQDEPIRQVDAGKGLDSLRRALDSAAGGEDPTGDDSLIARVGEERNRYLTAAQGKPTGDLARSEERLAAAHTTVADARSRYSELDAAVAEHASASAAHEARTAALVTVQGEVDRLERAGHAAAELREESRTADAEVQRARVASDAATRAHDERVASISARDRAWDKARELDASVEQAQALMEPADARAREARQALEGAEEAVTRARARLDALRAADEAERRRSDLAALDALISKVRAVGEDLAEREADLAGVALPDGTPEKIRVADEELREAVVRSAASAPRVEVSGEGPLTVGDEQIEASGGWAREIVEDTVFEIGEVALTVVPAGDTDSVRRDEAAARARLGALLEEAGVDTASDAERRRRRADDVQAEIAALRRRRADLLGDDTPEDLDRRRRELADRIAAEPDGSGTEAPAPAPDSATEDDPVEAASEAERKLAGLRAADRTAASEAASHRTELATRTALTADAARAADEAEAALAAARESATDTELAAAVEESTSVLEVAQEAARSARDRLQEALADAPPELLENAKSSLASLAAEERDSAAVVATALGRVNWIGGQGRLDEVSSAERELEDAERENRALWRRARAADLLHRTLARRRSEAMRAYQEPFHRAVVDLGSLVYGRDFDVELDEDLTIRSRRIGSVTVDYDSLSGGAREQLSVIVRIACARLVGDDGVPVFLDDAMGYTDPTRRFSMGAVIAAAAATSQIIVLTCDRARFAGIGGARTHTMRRAVAEEE
ncbi:MAG TPA: AAA family ATPase [Candidatus Dietzia intestinipullorum]|nr:AAA family ATPase [Candidatus Dietzia intestinipullorum]